MEIQEATTLALSLMVEHGLGEWKLVWSKSRRVFGRCIYRTRSIELSKPLVFRNPEAEVRDTILHEIAHALTPGAGHGSRWKAVCRKIGAKPVRCYSVAEVVVPAKRWKLVCLGCRKVLDLTDTRKPLDSKYHVPCGVVRGVLRYAPNKKG